MTSPSSSAAHSGNGTSSSSSQEEYEFMSNFSPSLIHRVLLTDAVDFPNLTMSGSPRPPTLTFWTLLHSEGYVKEGEGEVAANENANVPMTPTPTPASSFTLSTSSNSLVETTSHVIHKAFHDALLQQLQTTTSYQPLHPLILELHETIRSILLQPHDSDTHEVEWNQQLLVTEQYIKHHADGDVLSEMLPWLIQIGSILIQSLESEERSQSTIEWNGIARYVSETCSGQSDPKRKVSCMEEEEGMTLDFLVSQTSKMDDPEYEEEMEGGEELTSHERGHDKVKVTLGYCEFAVASISFLRQKLEQCQMDVMDFQLANVLAPRMHALGRDYMMKLFQEKFKRHDDDNLQSHQEDSTRIHTIHAHVHVPHLKSWLEETIRECGCTVQDLSSSEEQRGAAVLQTGWVDNILFRSPRNVDIDEQKEDGVGEDNAAVGSNSNNAPFYMPEILYLDVRAVRSIRMTAKLSVVGSVLALHASTIAGGAHKLKADPMEPGIQECRQRLVVAMSMSNRNYLSQEEYEETIGDAVLHLAQVLRDGAVLPSGAEDTLRSRTVAVMKMEDPVIKLLDDRMKNVFRDMMMFHPQSHQQVPTSIRTGRKLALSKSENTRDDKTTFGGVFKKFARQEFVKKGFSFYAEELADAALMANQIMNLSLYLYGSSIVEPVLLEELSSTSNV